MQKEEEIFIRGLVGESKPFKWIKEKIELLSSLEGVNISENAIWKFNTIEIKGDPNQKDIICQKESGDQTIGVVLSFTNNNLIYSTVFLELSNKTIYVRKARNKKEVYYEVSSGKIHYVEKSTTISKKR
ncbi:hypothetical protein A2W13_01360 [Candidatus Woesebacteria bacterium RBG_16_36_11]|uniref:Uncharacterized protein n=3 Tax=Candidatus Woeseibacteriota TaxID=1752722 RepID=A0A1F7XD75_9BACT|nr:MAG: hypothetical protein A2Z67_03365 [Candidatus Woesebacteria bacterium RBG_13_36_22]OGM12275.1 MAG: hypothetical protein A2W13_01360 [Candidatus Woesebacteria bacterium RBG_16_36_11]OGM16307.1 MAG: hypothetical protein A2V55_01155 [Candidatus Woesebacteria bacterium RBG_19FT_COMBO_37_29]